MTQKIAKKFNPDLCQPDMELHQIILAQYGIDWEKLFEPEDVTNLYMPQDEQDKMAQWIIDNWEKWPTNIKVIREREMRLIQLDIFPSAVLKDED
jgi:hypothetical protein